jgi:hypothetical protein
MSTVNKKPLTDSIRKALPGLYQTSLLPIDFSVPGLVTTASSSTTFAQIINKPTVAFVVRRPG